MSWDTSSSLVWRFISVFFLRVVDVARISSRLRETCPSPSECVFVCGSRVDRVRQWNTSKISVGRKAVTSQMGEGAVTLFNGALSVTGGYVRVLWDAGVAAAVPSSTGWFRLRLSLLVRVAALPRYSLEWSCFNPSFFRVVLYSSSPPLGWWSVFPSSVLRGGATSDPLSCSFLVASLSFWVFLLHLLVLTRDEGAMWDMISTKEEENASVLTAQKDTLDLMTVIWRDAEYTRQMSTAQREGVEFSLSGAVFFLSIFLINGCTSPVHISGDDAFLSFSDIRRLCIDICEEYTECEDTRKNILFWHAYRDLRPSWTDGKVASSTTESRPKRHQGKLSHWYCSFLLLWWCCCYPWVVLLSSLRFSGDAARFLLDLGWYCRPPLLWCVAAAETPTSTQTSTLFRHQQQKGKNSSPPTENDRAVVNIKGASCGSV